MQEYTSLILLKSILLIALSTILPIVIGRFFAVRFCEESNQSLGTMYISGVTVVLSVFFLLSLVATTLKLSLSLLCIVWVVFMLVLVLYELIKDGKMLVKDIAQKLKNTRIGVLSIIIGILILGDIILICSGRAVFMEDSSFLETSTTALHTDTLNQINPFTGMELSAEDAGYLSYTSFAILWAVMGRLFMLHPAVIVNMLMPIMFICMFFVAVYTLGKIVFKEDKQAEAFLFFVVLVSSFGNWAESVSGIILLDNWYGKPMICATFVMFSVFHCIGMNNNSSRQEWVLPALVGVAVYMVSSLSAVFFIVMLVMLTLLNLFTGKKRNSLRCFIGVMPVAFLIVMRIFKGAI